MQTEDKERIYYAVIFTSIQTKAITGYSMMADKIEALAKLQTRFLGVDSLRNGIGITVSYRKNRETIKQ